MSRFIEINRGKNRFYLVPLNLELDNGSIYLRCACRPSLRENLMNQSGAAGRLKLIGRGRKLNGLAYVC